MSAARKLNAEPSPFAQSGATLIDRGYSPIPIMPRTKRPGTTYGLERWTEYCAAQAPPNVIEGWSRFPSLGIGIACGYRGLVGIDVDTDCPEVVADITCELPPIHVAKRGKRGFTAFFRAAGQIDSTKFKFGENDEHGLDVLSHGTQSILPPSLHAD